MAMAGGAALSPQPSNYIAAALAKGEPMTVPYSARIMLR
jgi:hypothetical protein